MKPELKERIVMIERGEVPEGYQKKGNYCIPINWNLKAIDNICEIVDYRGKTPTKTKEGIVLITAKNVKEGYIDYEISKEYVALDEFEEIMRRGKPQKGDILFTTEAPLGNVALVDNEMIALAQRIVKFRPIDSIAKSGYLKFYMLGSDFQSEITYASTGTTVKGIKGSRLKKIKVILPKINEQEKISSILFAWNRAIDLKEKLLEQKKLQKRGLMEKLLTGKVRLSGFYEKWDNKKVRDLFERVTCRNNQKSTNVLTISAQRGLIRQEDYFNKSVASATLDNYFLLRQGEFAYNKSYSNGYPMGAIKRLNDYRKGVVTTLYICFKMKGNIGSTDFFEQYFEAGMMNKSLTKVTQEGARAHGLLNISPDDFFGIKIYIPSKAEQEAIANILVESDKEIKLMKEDIKQLKAQKKGLMQLLLTGKVRVSC